MPTKKPFLTYNQQIHKLRDEAVRYQYNFGGQITSATGTRRGVVFPYVKEIGYDEHGQRAYIEYGSGVKTRYEYDPYRRWLSGIRTDSPEGGSSYQAIGYRFDDAGNVLGYENRARNHTTSQSYEYDGLYQLTGVNGQSRSHPGGAGGNEEYLARYRQEFAFSRIGNMTAKRSEGTVSNPNRVGADLNYNLDYVYYSGTHKAERIGSRFYRYDLNGNLTAEREGGHATDADVYRAYHREGDLYWADYGFGTVRPGGGDGEDAPYQRRYQWNERNLLSESSDRSHTVQYRYGADGQRALKFVANGGRTTAYFNKMWQMSDAVGAEWLQGKHVYVGEDRIATKYSTEGNDNTQAEERRVYYYHSDHLGSAQTVTNFQGQVHERLEYTPYGELWIDWSSREAPQDGTPFRFTGKELDAETGLYYYGARYLDPKTSRWLSGDPAMGEYIPSAPVNDEARKRNGNLPGMGGVFNHVNLHVYHYAGNNPVKYTDPDGETITITGSRQEARSILRSINNISHRQYRLIKGPSGLYELSETRRTNRKGSLTYSNEVSFAIASERNITLTKTSKGRFPIGDSLVGTVNVEDFGGGVTLAKEFLEDIGMPVPDEFQGGNIHILFDNFNSLADSNGVMHEITEGEGIMHELTVHANPLLRGDRQRGKASLETENKIREELGTNVGLQFRPGDSTHE